MIRNATKRKSDIRIHERLPNGMLMNLYFKRWRVTPFNQWRVALCISQTRKEANLWNEHEPTKMPIIGDGSVNGLCVAFRYIMEAADSLGETEELIVQWTDDRRKSAYRILKRYGFQDYCDPDTGELNGYGIRNPKYWKWQDKAN